MRAIVDSAPDAPAAIAGLTTHAVNQQVRAGIAEAAVRKLAEQGYPANQPGRANLKIGANWIAEQFGCLSMTLEMPFKDIGDGREQRQGWSPTRSRLLGRANLDAIYAVLRNLR